MQNIKTISCNILSHNSNLMNINFGKLHYQRMLFSYENNAINLMSFNQPLKAIMGIIQKMKSIAFNNCYSISDV